MLWGTEYVPEHRVRSRADAGGKRSLRILVLHQHYWPEIAATAQILSDLCEDLAKLGHDVTVLCGQPSYRASGERRSSTEEHEGVRIRRVWAVNPRSRSVPSRLVHYGTYFGSSLSVSLRAQRPDVCLVMSTPPLLLGMSGLLLKQLRGIPFVYSVQDLYPDIAINLGVMREQSLITKSIEATARLCYRSAAAIVTLSAGMGTKLAAKSIPEDRIHIIPNWADTEAIQPAPRDNPFARAHGLCERFTVQYSGNLGLSQGLEHILDAATMLADEPIQLVFIGDGSARPALEAQARRLSLRNVMFLPPQPRQDLRFVLGSCDVGLVTMKRGISGDLVPSKLYGIMAAARPVMAAVEDDSEVARVVRDHACGWVVEPESPADLAASLKEALRSSRTTRNQFGRRAREACTAHYARSVSTQRYGHVLARASRCAGRASTTP